MSKMLDLKKENEELLLCLNNSFKIRALQDDTIREQIDIINNLRATLDKTNADAFKTIEELSNKVKNLSMTPSQKEYEEEINNLKNSESRLLLQLSKLDLEHRELSVVKCRLESENFNLRNNTVDLSSLNTIKKNASTFFNKFNLSVGSFDTPATWEIAEQELEEIIANARQEGRDESDLQINQLINKQDCLISIIVKKDTQVRNLRIDLDRLNKHNKVTPEDKGFVYLQNSEAIEHYSGFKLKYFDQTKLYKIGDMVRYNNLVWIKINDPETTKLEESYKEIELFTDNNKLTLREISVGSRCRKFTKDKSITASDTIITAIQKLNGNKATNANLTGVVTSVGNATSIANYAVDDFIEHNNKFYIITKIEDI